MSAELMSPHSFRRYLACALKAEGAADSTIQALLRWKSAESLKLYAILNDNTYADLVDSAANANVASVRTATHLQASEIPRVSERDALPRFGRTGALDKVVGRALQSFPRGLHGTDAEE